MSDTERRCANCVWWDYRWRVYGRLSFKYNENMAGGRVELRQCRAVPIPGTDQRPCYTDEDFVCSAFERTGSNK